MRDRLRKLGKKALEWANTHLHPISIRDRARARRHAEQMHTENRTSNSFHQIPVELIWEIAECLGGVDMLSLSATSRYFRAARKTTPSTRSCSELAAARRAFHERMVEDWRIQQAKWEEGQDTATLKTLLCNACYTRHAQLTFTREARVASPYIRTCFGTSGELRVCSHRTLNFHQMKKLRQQRLRGYICELHTDEGPSLAYLITGPLDSVVILHRIARGSQYGPIPCEQVRRVVNSMAEYLCPHLRASTEEIFTILRRQAFGLRAWLELPAGAFRGLEERTTNDSPWPFSGLWDSKTKCPRKHCHTGVKIWSGKRDHAVFVSVCRKLGPLDSPMEKSWIAQLEAAL